MYKIFRKLSKKKGILSCHSYIDPIYEESDEIIFLNFLKKLKIN